MRPCRHSLIRMRFLAQGSLPSILVILFFTYYYTQALSHSHSNKARSSAVHDSKIQWAKEKEAIVLIDVENVRGKAQFQVSHTHFFQQAVAWTRFQGLESKVSLVIDHGSTPSGYYSPSSKIAVIFAGPRLKADDVIARDVAALQRNALVITADNELMSRCRLAMNTVEKAVYEVQFLHPIKLISDFEAITRFQDDIISSNHTTEVIHANNTSNMMNITDLLMETIDEEIKIRGGLYDTEAMMKKKSNKNSPKERRKLEKRARMLCERLAQKSGGGQSIDRLTAVDSAITDYEREFQNAVLEQWVALRRTAARKEMTGDRIILAEHFRRTMEKQILLEDKRNIQDLIQIEDSTLNHSDASTMVQQGINPSLQHVQHVHSLMGIMPSSLSSNAVVTNSNIQSATVSKDGGPNLVLSNMLRMVVVSDTHGFEESLTSNSPLPEGDLLLHLGDFSVDGSIRKKKDALRKFDEWLSMQNHRLKVVLRGNHDPFSVTFSQSNALYYTGPKSIAVDGKFVLTVVPYTSARVLSGSWRKLPMQCDVLASHVPPFNILDGCYNGQHAGCNALRSKVEKMIPAAPRLWLCGHIHEARGSAQVKFGISSKETIIINASNANSGRANRIDHGPIVVDIDVHGGVNVVSM